MPPPRAASFAASAVCRGLAAAAVPAAAVGLASPLPSSLLALQARALGAAGAVVRTARRTAEGPLSPCRRDRSPAVRGCFRSVRVRDGRCHFAHSSLPLRVASDASDSAEVEAQAERYLKRFWKTASVAESADGFRILLDNRPLKTPEGRLLVVPSHRRTLAMLVAGEWERQETVLKSHSLPLTSLVARSIDGLSDWDARKSAIDKLMKFLETDTVCYQQAYPDSLVQLQQEYCAPIVRWIQDYFDVTLSVTKELIGVPHPEETIARLRKEVEGMEPLSLAAFEKATIHAKSFLIALALVKRAVSAKTASRASRVEVMSQIMFWGEEDSHDLDEAVTELQLGATVCAFV